jgi:hypothetical protein
VYAPPSTDEGLSSVGGALTDARDEDNVGGRLVARATRKNLVDGQVVLGPDKEAAVAEEQDASSHEAIVLASGGLGLIYLPEGAERLTAAEIDGLHPRLISSLTSHPGIGFVMVATDDGPVALGPRGSHRLTDGTVTGEDPLPDFGPNIVQHLLRTDGFPHCPDLLVNCMYDPVANEVAPFEEFMGSHGGVGGWQSQPFAMVPAAWKLPSEPVVGARAMHDALRGWLAASGQQLRPHGPGRAD